jgi:hypothetical protein
MDAAAAAAMQQQIAAAVWAQLQQQQQAAGAPAVAAAAPHSARPRLPAPAAFDGAASKLDEWRADLLQQFDYYAITSDAERLRFAAGHMRGAARDWWTYLEAAARPATWDALIVALRARFQPVTTATTARAKLHALSQGKASVHAYVSAFRALLVAVPDMGDADRLFAFQRGLQPAIALQLQVHGVTTLESAIAMATRIGSFGDAHAASRAAFGPSAAAPSSASAPMDLSNVEGFDQNEPQDTGTTEGTQGESIAELRAEMRQMLNAMRAQRGGHSGGRGGPAGAGAGARGGFSSNLPRIPHLSPLQVKEYMDAGKCFVCGATEHRSRDCPKRADVFEQSGNAKARRGGFGRT